MPKFDAEMEARITKAIKFIYENPGAKVKKIAREFVVSYDTLRRRIQGVPDQRVKGGHNTALTTDQDAALKSYVSFLIHIGQPPNKQGLRSAANAILKTMGREIGVAKNWASRWLTRNKKWFHTVRARTLAAERKMSHQKEEFERHFEEFRSTCTEYGIAEEDIWNFDESGFRIGCLAGRIVITHASTKSVFLADPEQRESITSIECISGGGETIPPMLILSGSVMLEKHFQNSLHDDTLLAITKTGYTNQFLSLEWLKHWNKHTEKKKKGIWRMLIFDGHRSHLSNDFLFYCWEHKVIPFLLPPHTTHLLQPLDVGIFQPLKHWHQVALHDSIQYGDLEFSKIEFLNAYQKMRDRTFKSTVILSAWRKVGLIKFDPDEVYRRMKHWEPEQPVPERPITPVREYMAQSDQASIDHSFKPFQTTPTSANREAHRMYLHMRLEDHFDDIQPITPSYQTSMVKFNKSTNRLCLKAKLIEERELNRQNQAIEKANRKAASSRHVQKNGAITMGIARSQILERNVAEEEYRDSIRNSKLERIIAKDTKIWKKIIKEIPKLYKREEKNLILYEY